MSRLTIRSQNDAQSVLDGLYRDIERRVVASPPGLCPVDASASFLKLCHAQTCGKCVPCRIGLGQLYNLLEDVLDGRATPETLDLIETTARVIKNSADCAIGVEAARMVLTGVVGFRDDYMQHITQHRCLCNLNQPAPCVAYCPAGVDIPGYIALIGAGRHADAVRLIRKDNPFPVSCALVCEHPCETRCRRNMIDDSINIRGLKRFAVDHAGEVPVPDCAESTGKKIAIIGGGPAGLTAAYFLSLMGHSATVYEKRKYLGGMLRYGIPSYRLPRERLNEDIDAIISTGVTIHTGVDIGSDITLRELHANFDALYIAIGAQTDKKLGIEGENARGVMSAVEMLRSIGDGDMPDFTNKNVVVIGGGNVAMDCTRSAKRLGASSVTCVYRRRQEDMTALPDEVEGAIAEGCEVMSLLTPVRIETDDQENVTGLWVQPQIIGTPDKSGRPRPFKANAPEKRLACDIVLVAIGQDVEHIYNYEELGIPVYWGTINAKLSGDFDGIEGVFSGGDCVTGPASAIRAIAAGKVAAANIDEYLGYHHTISCDVVIPDARLDDRPPCGRIKMTERPSAERQMDFSLMECGMTEEEALQEANRCLRCDHFGYGVFKGGRSTKW